MKASRGTPRGTVVAAVAFDAQLDAVVQTAVSLSRRFDLDVRFVHVVESAYLSPMMASMSSYYPYYPIEAGLEEEEVKAQEARLKEVVASIPAPVRASGVVRTGFRTQAVIAECTAQRANLLVTAYGADAHRLTAVGLSTALSLMHEAPLPVMAVTVGAIPDFAKPGFRVLVADDLQENTREAVHKAYQLAAGLEHAHLRHVHVHGDFRELLRDSWRDLRDRLPGKTDAELTPDRLWAEEYETRVKKAHEQAAPFDRMAEGAKVRVEVDVRSSTRVADELYEVAADANADLLVFGRHRVLKARPFLVGRMPLRAMLQMKRPVLMVPPAAELYANLPFPAAK